MRPDQLRFRRMQEIEYIRVHRSAEDQNINETYVDLTVTGHAEVGKLLPWFRLFPFIENAFKHTNNKEVYAACNCHQYRYWRYPHGDDL